jgi:hypothetical protein
MRPFVYKGETWSFVGAVRDASGAVVDLTGAVLTLTIARTNGTVLLTLTTPTGGVITDAEAGTYEFSVQPEAQDDVPPGAVQVQLKAVLADDTVSIQSLILIDVNRSL